MNWLIPSVPALSGSVRTIGDPPKAERTAARHQRNRSRTKAPSRAAYHRQWHADNADRRRPYLTQKAREYRARRTILS